MQILKLIISLFGGSKGEKSRNLVSWGGAGVVLLILVFLLLTGGDQGQSPPILSFLQQVQVEEELMLVTFYHNEMIEIGTPDKTQLAIDKLQKQIEKERDKVNDQKVEVTILQSTDAGIVAQQLANKRILDSLSQWVDSLRLIDDRISHFVFEKNVAALDSLSDDQLQTLYGTKLKQTLQTYQQLIQQEGTGHKYRRALRNAKDALKAALSTTQKRTQPAYLAARNIEKNQRSRLDPSSLKKKQRETERKIEKAQEKYTALQTQYQNSQARLLDLQKALADANNPDGDGEFKKARVLSIVPARVSTLVNMKKIQIEEQGDSLIKVQVDSIYLGEVEVLLAEARHYNNQEKDAISLDQENPYFVIFEQLQVDVPKVQKKVLESVQTSGIYAQSCQQLQHYFERLASGTGRALELKIRNCIDTLIVGNSSINSL